MAESSADLPAGMAARADEVLRKIGEARELYHRLVLLVGPAGSGKTQILQAVAAVTSAPLVNVNLELARGMLELTERQRTLQLPRLLRDVCASRVEREASEVLLLDNLEILFDVKLKQDPLRLLQRLSRNKTIVAAWPGRVIESRAAPPGANHIEYEPRNDSAHGPQHSSLVYAVPDHPEYRRYPIRDLIIVSASSVQRRASGGQV